MVGRLYRLEPEGRKGRRSRSSSGSAWPTRPTASVKAVRRHAPRLDLGASLVGRPRLLILDEPTTGLDPAVAQRRVGASSASSSDDGTTVLLTTQYLDEADNLADHIVVIDHGKVIADGTPRELKARMGADVLELHLADPDALEPTAAAAARHRQRRAGIDLGDRRITLPVHQGAADLMSAVRRLDELGIVPSDLSLRRPSLDDVFLALTGRGATLQENEEVAAMERHSSRRPGRRARLPRLGRASPTPS